MTDTHGFQTKVVSYTDPRADYKIAIRFPKGPVASVRWTETRIERRHTLAHKAVLCDCPTLRRQMILLARPLCNPLVKCDRGWTALETMERRTAGATAEVRWQDKRLLMNMRKDHDEMLVYIHRDALLFGTTTDQLASIEDNESYKKPLSTSPFHRLSDDVCRTILSFI